MNFLIADSFTDSLARLTGEEQKAVKTTAFDLQMNLAGTGLSFHKLSNARDKNFASVRVSADLRIIVHRTAGSLLLCYVDHHDKAYEWAERRKLVTHPQTGAAQLVEIRETVQQIFIPLPVTAREAAPASAKTPTREKGRILAKHSREELLSYGVPEEWLKDVMEATEDSLLSLADHLPAEAAEALLELATGGKPRMPQPAPPAANPFDHPDAQRRFRVMSNVEELERALDFPWDKWTVFLHPEQRQWVERSYTGPARVSGSAGTGKTIVALHRAVHLARANPDARVLLTTFSQPLAKALYLQLKRLIGHEPRLGERIEISAVEKVGLRLHKSLFGVPAKLAGKEQLVEWLKSASKITEDHKFSPPFLLSEWDQVVDAWQLDSWEAYRDVARLGRRTRLPEPQRKLLWSIFEKVREKLAAQKMLTSSGLFTALAAEVSKGQYPPFDFVVVDEAQDIGVAQLRFFAALGGDRPEALFFAGDLGQRIFQQPFSWKSAGVDIRGRSRTLRINYRTSHQIRKQADRLLAPEVADMDGNTEQRADTVSVFNGPPPSVRILKTHAAEISTVGGWLAQLNKAGIEAQEFGIFVRSAAQLVRAKAAAEAARLPFQVLDENLETGGVQVSISTMHLAKGLEFRAVVVMACDDEVIPLQERMETMGDDGDLQELYDTERQLLYVACTRARDHLLITGTAPASEFLDDFLIQ